MGIIEQKNFPFNTTGIVGSLAARCRIFLDSAPTILCIHSTVVEFATFPHMSISIQHILIRHCLNTVLIYVLSLGTMYALRQQTHHLPAKDGPSFLRFWLNK